LKSFLQSHLGGQASLESYERGIEVVHKGEADVLGECFVAVAVDLFGDVLTRGLDVTIAGHLSQPHEQPNVWLHFLNDKHVAAGVRDLLLGSFCLLNAQSVEEAVESLSKAHVIALLLWLGSQRVVVQDLGLLDLVLQRFAILRFESGVEYQHRFDIELRVIKLHLGVIFKVMKQHRPVKPPKFSLGVVDKVKTDE